MCIPKFGEDQTRAMFSVFDGHGAYGDVCARFTAEKVRKGDPETKYSG